jgi:plastocyanin
MKKITTFLISIVLSIGAFATQYTVNFNGFSYTPPNLQVNVGDTVNLPASTSHRLVQVDQATWTANGSTQLTGGFNTVTNIQIVISSTENIYYVCATHVGSGMKGKIEVSVTNGVEKMTISKAQIPTIYPNPAQKGLLKINTEESVKLVVTDAIGNTVLSSVVFNSWDCDLNSGIYFYYTILNNKRSKTQKLIIQ